MRRQGVRLNLKDVLDTYIRDNFKKLQEFFDLGTGLEAFQAIEFQVTQATGEFKIRTSLGAVPKDIILSQLIAASGTKLRFHTGLFTAQEIVVSSTGPLRARFLVGSFTNVVVATPGDTVPENSTDLQEYTA